MITHKVPYSLLSQLAAGAGDLAGVLRAGQRSKRLLLLRELLARARRRSPEVFAEASASETFALLSEAHRYSRYRVDDLLLKPNIGAWVTACLRSLATGGISRQDLGHAGAVAAVAALRSGMRFEVTTYVRDGHLMLPTLGEVLLPGMSGWCRIRGGPDVAGVEIADSTSSRFVRFDPPGHDGLAWSPLRELKSTAGGLTIEVQLDDLDPYRDWGHLDASERLDRSAFDHWQVALDEAWTWLVADDFERAQSIRDGVTTIVPLEPHPASDLSGSAREAISAIAMSPPRTPLAFALALVHEFQHNKLSALLDLLPLHGRVPDQRFYAPWRPDPRPLAGFFQGAYAFLGLTAFWDRHRRPGRSRSGANATLAHFEFAVGRDQVARALGALEASSGLSSHGAWFVADMRRRTEELAQLPVPSLPLSLARLACRDHATSWRLRNVRPDADQVAHLADAWIAGRSCSWSDKPRAVLVDGGTPIASTTRHVLLRERLTAADPDGWAPLEPNTADALFATGRYAQAAEAFRARLVESPDDMASWAGLALVCGEESAEVNWAMTYRPEWVYATHNAIRERCGGGPEPDDLAKWVAVGAAAES